MRILVTGGAGFIGSAMIRYLIKETNYEVLNIDNLTYAGNLESLNEVSNNGRYSFERVDICERAKIRNIFLKYKPTKVIHFAAESHVDNSILKPGKFIDTNIFGTYSLLDASIELYNSLEKNQKKDFRFHHVSTDEVYGDLGIDGTFFYEDTPYNPSSPYSASKASSDHLVRAWNRTYGLPVTISNCSNNYGPFHHPEKLIPNTIIRALKKEAIGIYGNGQQIRDWLYVDDHIKGIFKIVFDGIIGETYNIGGNNERSNNEVVNIICSYLDEIAQPTNSIGSHKELIRYIKDRPGHDLKYAINSDKLSKNLGWKQEENFESGIKKTINWYIENENWWNNISI